RLGGSRPRRQVASLLLEQPKLGLQLELDRLRRLAGEPELTPRRVVPDALAGHSRHRRAQQLLERNNGQSGDDLLRVLSDEDDEAAKPRRADVLDQLEPTLGRRRENRRRTMAERCGDRPLGAGLDLELAQREALPL